MDLDTVIIRLEEDVAIAMLRAVLSAVSTYLKNVFDGPFIESAQRTIALPDVSEPTFSNFVQWANIQVFGFRPAVKVLSPESLLLESARTPSSLATGLAGEDLHQNSYGIDDDGYYGFDERGFRPARAPIRAAQRALLHEPGLVGELWQSLPLYCTALHLRRQIRGPSAARRHHHGPAGTLLGMEMFPDYGSWLIKPLQDDLPASFKFTKLLASCTAWAGSVSAEDGE